jgi:leucyl aminopeptidase
VTVVVTAVRGPLSVDAAAVLAVPVAAATEADGPPVAGAGAEVLAGLGIDVTGVLAAEDATGKPGEVVSVIAPQRPETRALLVGVGDGSHTALRKAAAALVRAAKAQESVATTLGVGRETASVRAVAEAVGLASYRFSRRSEDKPPALARVDLVVDAPARVWPAVAAANAVTAAVHLARDLANNPSLEKSPAWLADQARRLGKAAGVAVAVRDEKALSAEGFGGVLAVGRGSSRPPRFVEMTWSPRGAKRHLVLVGKGITFDSGGLSLKRPDAMPGMKTDMSGGAAVIATMTALRALGVKAKVTGLIPMAENLPGSDATRPGDVIRHYGGLTSEVLNTDAEGRLVLADALSYAVARLSPDAVVDIATLTGAAALGLGKRHGALYTTSDDLRDQLVEASTAAGERLWPMPLVEDYRFSLDSSIADLRNIARRELNLSGGSIVAALYLREFVGDVPWAHLDVAGPARADADEDEVTKGATGFGVRTFCRWLAEAP